MKSCEDWATWCHKIGKKVENSQNDKSSSNSILIDRNTKRLSWSRSTFSCHTISIYTINHIVIAKPDKTTSLNYSISKTRFSKTSSSAILFRCCFWHCVHWKSILEPPAILKSNWIGFIIPWHVVFLSPGISPSTWSDVKQYGQWLRQVLAAGGTCLWQCTQTNHSLIVIMSSIKKIKRKNNSSSVGAFSL